MTAVNTNVQNDLDRAFGSLGKRWLTLNEPKEKNRQKRTDFKIEDSKWADERREFNR